MAIHFHESEVAKIAHAPGAHRQRLLDRNRLPEIKFVLDRITLDAGSTLALDIGPADLGWFQVIEGETLLRRDGVAREDRLDRSHVSFLPPGFRGELATATGAVLVMAQVPNVTEIDPALAADPPPFRLVDWTEEPLLLSEHDARKRIYLVTSRLFGTKAIKGEMVIYPPNTEAPEHFHVGGAHFMYFLDGSGTCYASGQPMPVKKGDVVYYHDLEPHNLKGGPDGMSFSEFFVPGGVKTEWPDPSKICTWIPTGRNIKGGVAARELKTHAHSELADV